jgi:hypothetical protein
MLHNDREILLALLEETRRTMREGAAHLDLLANTQACKAAFQRVYDLATEIDTTSQEGEDRVAIVKLVAVVRSALVPARFTLYGMTNEPHAEAARQLLQQLLDFATEAVNDLPSCLES